MLDAKYQNQMDQTARCDIVSERRDKYFVNDLKKKSINLIKWDIKRASDEIVKNNLRFEFLDKHRKAYFRCLITLH